MFSKACQYGLKATIFIATKSQNRERVTLNEIAYEINSPIAFTAKVLQKLTKNKIIDSVKGPTGGFKILKPDTIHLIQIVIAIDGDSIFKVCGLGLTDCNDKKPCPVHHKFKTIRNNLKKMLATTTLLDLLNDIDLGKTFLKN